jgi:hypothetical protein
MLEGRLLRYVLLIALPLLAACAPHREPVHSSYVENRHRSHDVPRSAADNCGRDVQACPSPPPANDRDERRGPSMDLYRPSYEPSY